uniref:Uncharacterized protein n=1 Tax=Manihot esculenta TaxID=3983 RepID=A0A2C9VMX7_MANES
MFILEVLITRFMVTSSLNLKIFHGSYILFSLDYLDEV